VENIPKKSIHKTKMFSFKKIASNGKKVLFFSNGKKVLFFLMEKKYYFY
jgi:hypothetical protein